MKHRQIKVYYWGFDFNHESPHTKEFVSRVVKYWLEEYKFDGYRFDFTKGFTNTLLGKAGPMMQATNQYIKRNLRYNQHNFISWCICNTGAPYRQFRRESI
jgi:1,4-alpha-glucan branching enzyme